MNRDVIIALDFASANQVFGFLDAFREGEKPFVKIGMELFYAEGPEIVREIKRRGHRVFLDLKLHDIPNTVKKAMRVLSNLDVDMVNLHAAGTIEMMAAALEGLTRPDGSRPLLLAVTQLTSTSEQRMREELLIDADMPQCVAHYADNARKAGLDGVVCSPLEAALVKKHCGDGFLTVTPGIRFAEGDAQDQVRIMTPERARLGGSDCIVVGRPITAADDPVAAYRRCVDEFTKGHQTKMDEMKSALGMDQQDMGAALLGNLQSAIAKDLLDIGAVFLRPDQPFTWASGIKSPIYCDNRLTLSAPEVRTRVELGLKFIIETHYKDAEVLMGTSTAGIAHAAITAQLMGLPMGYVRSGAKDHGRTNQIEGRLEKGQKVVVVEDLISTGGSVIEVVEALRQAGADVLGIASIFTYGMKKGLDRLEQAGVQNISLSGFDALVEVAAQTGHIKPEDKARLIAFRDNPSDESWMTR